MRIQPERVRVFIKRCEEEFEEEIGEENDMSMNDKITQILSILESEDPEMPLTSHQISQKNDPLTRFNQPNNLNINKTFDEKQLYSDEFQVIDEKFRQMIDNLRTERQRSNFIKKYSSIYEPDDYVKTSDEECDYDDY